MISRSTSARWRQHSAGEVIAWARRVPWDARLAIALCAGALVLRLLPLGAFSAEYDEGVYWQSLRAMAAGHPLYSSVFYSQPPLFLLAVYPFFLLFGQTLAAARLALALYSLIGIAALYAAGRMLGGRWAGVLAAALLAVDPLYLHASVTLEAEGLSVALSALAVALAVRAASRPSAAQSPPSTRRWWALASGAALMAAILVKLFAVAALVPIVIYLTLPLWPALLAADGRLRWSGWAALRLRLRMVAPDLGWCALGLAGTALVVLLPFASVWGPLATQVFGYHLAAAHADTSGMLSRAGAVWGTQGVLPLTLPALGALALLVWRRLWSLLPPLLWALAAFLLLARQQPLFAHHVVLLSPALALSGGIALATGMRELRSARVHLPEWGELPLVHTAALLLIVAALLFGVTANLATIGAARQYIPVKQLQMALALEATTRPDDAIITDDPYVAALADRAVPPQLVDASAVRITSGYLTAGQLEALITRADAHTILFASGRFDQIPGFRAWVGGHFQQVAAFGDGHALYIKAPRGQVPV